MVPFTKVKLISPLENEIVAENLNGEVDSFENPCHATLRGAWLQRWEPSRFVGQVFNLEGYNTANRKKNIRMKLGSTSSGTHQWTFIAAVNV